MTRMSSMSITLASLAAAALAAAAAGHDFWLQPATSKASVGAAIPIEIMIGHGGHAESRPRDPARIVRFVCIGPQGTIDVPGVNGERPAGVLRATGAGDHVIAYESTYSISRLAPEKFEAYLKEVGLESILLARGKRDATAIEPEAYMRCAKAVVRVTDAESPATGQGAAAAATVAPSAPGAPAAVAPSAPADVGMTTPVGMRLEIVPRRRPVAVAAGADPDSMQIQLLFEGKPLEGALVELKSMSSGGTVAGGRTDGRGEASLTVPGAGVWLMTAVHMVPAGERNRSAGAVWESVWASLVFEVP
jgi:uncharacterized GH25 family protein